MAYRMQFPRLARQRAWFTPNGYSSSLFYGDQNELARRHRDMVQSRVSVQTEDEETDNEPTSFFWEEDEPSLDHSA